MPFTAILNTYHTNSNNNVIIQIITNIADNKLFIPTMKVYVKHYEDKNSQLVVLSLVNCCK